MAHDFKKFPELTNSQMQLYYFESPHKQITEDFEAEVVKVHDGDTITLRTSFRDFDFPLRFLNIDAPELNEERGKESRDKLKSFIEGERIDVLINQKNRVDKWGRLLGSVFHRGMDIGDLMMRLGFAKNFNSRNEEKLPNIERQVKGWF